MSSSLELVSFTEDWQQFWRWQVRASSYNPNKLTIQMQQFYKFIAWRFVSLNHD